MENTLAVPNSQPLNAAPLKGRSVGALVCGGFGTIWMLQAVFLGGITSPAWIAAIAIAAVIFVASPAAQLYSLRGRAYATVDDRCWSAVSKGYWTIVTVESVACIVASNWLNYIHRPDLWPQFIGAIVGLHFFPLAKLFRAPIYRWTATAMTLGVLASMAIPMGGIRDLIACGLCGLTLWATDGAILWQYKH
jgi:hypothetical protein